MICKPRNKMNIATYCLFSPVTQVILYIDGKPDREGKLAAGSKDRRVSGDTDGDLGSEHDVVDLLCAAENIFDVFANRALVRGSNYTVFSHLLDNFFASFGLSRFSSAGSAAELLVRRQKARTHCERQRFCKPKEIVALQKIGKSYPQGMRTEGKKPNSVFAGTRKKGASKILAKTNFFRPPSGGTFTESCSDFRGSEATLPCFLTVFTVL